MVKNGRARYAALLAGVLIGEPTVDPSRGGGGTQTAATSSPSSRPPRAIVEELKGVVHVPTPEQPVFHLDLKVPPGGDYHVINVSLDFIRDEWYPQKPDGFHCLFWIHRGKSGKDWQDNNLGYVNLRGPDKNLWLVATNIGGQRRDTSRRRFERNKTYHLEYVLDARQGMAMAVISEGGKPVDTITYPVPISEIKSIRPGFFIELGQTLGLQGPESPSYGWVYSNLRVAILP